MAKNAFLDLDDEGREEQAGKPRATPSPTLLLAVKRLHALIPHSAVASHRPAITSVMRKVASVQPIVRVFSKEGKGGVEVGCNQFFPAAPAAG